VVTYCGLCQQKDYKDQSILDAAVTETWWLIFDHRVGWWLSAATCLVVDTDHVEQRWHPAAWWQALSDWECGWPRNLLESSDHLQCPVIWCWSVWRHRRQRVWKRDQLDVFNSPRSDLSQETFEETFLYAPSSSVQECLYVFWIHISKNIKIVIQVSESWLFSETIRHIYVQHYVKIVYYNIFGFSN